MAFRPARQSPTTVRLLGFVLLLCGLSLGCIGFWLTTPILPNVSLDWLPSVLHLPKAIPMTAAEILQSPLGLIVIYLYVFALVAALLGLFMIFTGRRSRSLVIVVLILCAIFTAFVVWTLLDGTGDMGQTAPDAVG